MGKTVLEEFVTILGYEIDGDDAKKYQKTLDEIGSSFKKIAVVAAAAATGVAIYTRSVAKSTDANFKFANSLGVSFEGLQRITGAMQIYGASASATQGVLANMATIISGLPLGQAPFGALSRLGVDPNGKTPEQLFEAIFKKLEAAPKSQRLALGAPLGFGLEMLNAIDNGWERLIKQAVLYDKIGAKITDDQGKVAEEFEDNVLAIGWAFDRIGNIVNFKLQPIFNEFAGDFIDWFIAAKESGKIARGMVLMEKAIRPVMIALAGVAAVLTAWFVAANAPLILITAAILGLAAIADDVKGHFEGKDAFLSPMIEQLEAAYEWLTKVDEKLDDFGRRIDKISFSGIMDSVAEGIGSIAAIGLKAARGGYNVRPGGFASSTMTNAFDTTINVNGGVGDTAGLRGAVDGMMSDASEHLQPAIVR